MNKKIVSIVGGILLLLAFVPFASAHVTVRPEQVGIGVSQDFTIGFGIEKDVPTTSVRLVIPDGVTNVAPYITPGWNIEVKKDGEREDAVVSEIVWSGGSVPPGQRGMLTFRAQVPSNEQTVAWKAYQTYQDGTIVSWDQDPTAMKDMSDSEKEDMEKTGKGPFSQTTIVNDLKSSEKTDTQSGAQSKSNNSVSIIALALSVVALGMQLTRKSK